MFKYVYLKKFLTIPLKIFVVKSVLLVSGYVCEVVDTYIKDNSNNVIY